MNVLVTGGAGFIGSHLVEGLLAHGHRVVVVDDLSTGRREHLHPAAAFYRVDIRDAGALEAIFDRERPEAVSHHAAQTDVRRSMREPAFDAHVNVVGVVNLLHLCVKYAVPTIVFASSSAVYPELPLVPADETAPVRPLSAYGLGKYVGERYLALFRASHGLRFTAFRYGNVFGPRQDPRGEAGVVAIFSAQMLAGVRPTLFGDGNKTRDYVYVDDVVAANLLAMHGAPDAEVLNLGWGREIRDLEVFDAVGHALGVRMEPRYAAKRPGELNRIALDSTRATVVLGWKPRVPFEEGVHLTTAAYRRSWPP